MYRTLALLMVALLCVGFVFGCAKTESTPPAAESPAVPAMESPTAPAAESPAAPAMQSPTAPAAENPAAPAKQSPTAPAAPKQ